MAQLGFSRLGRLGLPLGLGLIVSFFAVGVGGSCTIFTGIQDLPPPDAGQEAGASPPAYLPVADAARLCSLIFRCQDLPTSITSSSGVPVDPGNFSDCMTWLAGPIPPSRVGFSLQKALLECMAKATTCAGAAACGSFEQLAANDPRCADAGADAGLDRCVDNGATVLVCSGNFALHCSTPYFGPGSTCRLDLNGLYWCASGDNCNVQTSCLGSVLDYCGVDTINNMPAPTGLRFGINCGVVGNTCGLDPDSGADDCLTDGQYRACSGIDRRCTGDVVEVCNGSSISLFKCADLGAKCVDAQGTPRCARSDDACTPFDANVNVCNGSMFHLCVGGKVVDFDCASIGKSCKPPAGSVPAQCGT